MITGIFRLIAAGIALLAAQPVWAEWHEASSDHFVIYADDKEADIRTFAENLERYHSAMAFVLRAKVEKPSPSNRVTIFVVGDQRDMRALSGSRTIGGFYIPRAGGSRAFVQDIRNTKGYPHFSTIVLLHEYAHHFLISSTSFAQPRWLSEGSAEFFAAAGFNTDGSLLIGRPAQHRGGELAFADPVHVRELLDPELYEKQKGKKYDAFYGKSWLLYHYLTFSDDRGGQLGQYLVNLYNGMPALAAGESAFGDLDTLERELATYLRSKRMLTFVLPPDKLSTGSPITLRKLPPGEAAIMPVVIRSQRGVNEEQAAELLVEARAIATQHPEDPGVLAALAEAEYDAGNDPEAIAAADGAIARDPARTNAYVQKGYALFRQAGEADEKAAAYEAAMKPFGALNAIENDHPLPLIYYYRSYAERGAAPPENARAALERASRLAPFDQGLQLNAGMMLIKEGKFAIARDFLLPVAANPHGGGAAERARQMLDLLDKTPLEAVIDLGARPDDEDISPSSDAAKE
ncbi:hypothetical protein [Porphyrobacter sp. AAP60]|uniref:hypothetical protein n=1 Tax=Porphyrobacter sp. AAP60 TaxID=1523423 RepID=UPI0006B88930|nr:hypothetical protein [Porphyrobacter sp. AAP60]KPF61866.1 hypothetical protein IP79_13255 [Porphyrobacter sp. AAP60]